MSTPENIWAYCDTCQDTCPVNGSDVRDYLTTGEAHSYTDLVCANCHSIIATISIGPADGSPPVQPPLCIPLSEPMPAPTDDEQESPLRRVQGVELHREGERIQARIGELQGTADKLPDALRDLASAIECSSLTIWVPLAAKTYTEEGCLKAMCPECGYVKTFGDFTKVFAYVCPGCGLGVSVE